MALRPSMKLLAVAGALSAGVVSGSRSVRRHLRRAEEGRRQSLTMKALQPYYHTTEELEHTLAALAGNCPGMSVETVKGTGHDGDSRQIQVVTIKKPGTSPSNKNFLLFGEHARELISPESGLHFVKTLCGQTSLSAQAAEVLKDNEYQIVVNGNPGSRRKVEQGDFCLRVNPNGVDLNRNWDEEWQAGSILDPQDTNPGPKPFSEPETQVFKQLVTKYRPSMFLTVHSGTLGMYMPWAYDMEHLAKTNQPQMMQILRDVDKDHCQCPFGAAGKEVGYSCPGTCLDWVYDRLKTPYVFAFEIYAAPWYKDDLRQRWQEKMSHSENSFLQSNSTLAHENFKDHFVKNPSDFVQLRATQNSQQAMDPQQCFSLFNPGTQDDYNSNVDNWSKAYLDMATMIQLQRKSSNATV